MRELSIIGGPDWQFLIEERWKKNLMHDVIGLVQIGDDVAGGKSWKSRLT